MVEVSSSATTMNIVSCNLSTQRVRKDEIPKATIEIFRAGRAIASYLANNRISTGTHALGEKNHIFLCTSLLCQTTTVATKSPLKYGPSISILGPPYAEFLSKVGIRTLDIWGSAKEPTLIVLTERRVEFQEASKLWGLTIDETRKHLFDLFPGYDALMIGPSGEKGLRIAAVVHGRRQIGEDGLGAVLGSKNLKAILVEGNINSVPLDLEDEYQIHDAFVSPNGRNSLIANNFSKLTQKPFSGSWPGVISPSGFVFLGPNLGIYNKDDIIEAGVYCFDHGLSLRFVGATLGIFASLVEDDRISGFPDARFGSKSIYNLIRHMQAGKGIAHQMTFGPESFVTLRGEASPTVKGEVGLGIHPGASMGYALNFAVSNPTRTLIPQMEFLGLPINSNSRSWQNKGQFICWAEDFMAACDVLGLLIHEAVTNIKKWPFSGIFKSISSGAFFKHGITLSDHVFTQLQERGVDIDFKDIITTGARAILLERLFGTREGLTGSDDRLPPSFLISQEPSEFPSTVLSRQKFFRAKGEYYRMRGLLPSGMPSLETLRKLSLERIVAL